MLRVALFDVWNTLLNLDAMYLAVSEALSERVPGVSRGRAYRAIVETHRRAKALKALGKLREDEHIVDDSLNLLSQALEVPSSALKECIPDAVRRVGKEVVFEGAEGAVKYVKEVGAKAVLVGNILFWTSDVTKELLKEAGILQIIDRTYFADEVGVQKPSKEIFHMPLKEFGADLEEAMHVGDSVTEDFGGALSSGIAATLVTKEVKEALSVDFRIHFIPSIKDYPVVIERFNRWGM